MQFYTVMLYYRTGGEVLKLLRIKPLRKNGIKAVSCFIVKKLPHKDEIVLTILTTNSGGMAEYVLRLVKKDLQVVNPFT